MTLQFDLLTSMTSDKLNLFCTSFNTILSNPRLVDEIDKLIQDLNELKVHLDLLTSMTF